MKINIVEQKENPFLKRKEVIIELNHEGGCTPSKASLQQFMAKQLGTEANKIEIGGIFGRRGEAKSTVKVKQWYEKTVPLVTEKNSEKKEDKKEEKPKEGKKEEKTEEKSEEKKEEKPKEDTPEKKGGKEDKKEATQ